MEEGRSDVVPTPPLTLHAERMDLVLRGRDETLAMVEGLSPEAKAQVSPEWLARVKASPAADPWTHGFAIVRRADGVAVGQCGFKGPPDADGIVEIAYGVEPSQEGKGYATEAAAALAKFALGTGQVRVVRAHTLPDAPASQRVLTKCGFQRIGEVVDPEDGLALRWEKRPAQQGG